MEGVVAPRTEKEEEGEEEAVVVWVACLGK